MLLIMAFEVIVATIIIWTLITQVLIPVYRGTKLFPFFRKEEKLRNEIEEVNQQNVEKGLENELKKISKKRS
jgi:hypothetical protein